MAKGELRPVCFVVMPFGTKDTGIPDGPAPAQVNFNSLWQKALAPALENLGYMAVRADQDTGSLIIQEMLERLTLADLVVADMSIPNGNVYYEVGMRHATKADGCVLISADWSHPLFDTAQFRRITYPLPGTEVTDEQAAAIRGILEGAIEGMKRGPTPPFSLDGFPDLKPERAMAFREFVEVLAKFQAGVAAARTVSQAERPNRVKVLLEEYVPDHDRNRPILPGVAQELLFLVRDTLSWPETVAYVERLPKEIQELPTVQEQLWLARSKTGDHAEAIGALEKLIELRGDSSERRGLIGGRYKKLFQSATTDVEKRRCLSRAIEQYERGMLIDLNDYYPSSNLMRLLKMRDGKGDRNRARAVGHLVSLACERAIRRNAQDEWVKPTLLGAAFESEDVEQAQNLEEQIAQEGVVSWKLETTINDLRLSVQSITNTDVRSQLEAVIGRLERLLAES